MNANKTIIPVASGKGGVGKSMLVANLGIALARQGYQTTVVDLDLGGSNLHTCLGLPNRYPGVGEFLKGTHAAADLSHYRLQTQWPNLHFVPGDGKTPFMANIPPQQRKQLLAALGRLPGDYILLDLGAGSALNTLGLFGMVHRGLLVTTFETPAIMNLLTFLKNFSYWIMNVVAQHDEQVYGYLTQTFRATMADSTLTVTQLLQQIRRLNPVLAEEIAQRLQQYTPRIVFNMGDEVDELSVTRRITQAMEHGLSLTPEYFGFVRFDRAVHRSMIREEALAQEAPESGVVGDVERIAQRIAGYWRYAIPESAAKLRQSTEQQMRG